MFKNSTFVILIGIFNKKLIGLAFFSFLDGQGIRVDEGSQLAACTKLRWEVAHTLRTGRKNMTPAKAN